MERRVPEQPGAVDKLSSTMRDCKVSVKNEDLRAPSGEATVEGNR